MLFVAAMAFVAGVATQRFRGVMLAAACALGGAGLALSGLAQVFPQYLGFLRVPSTPALAAVAAAVWLVLAGTGWVVQRRTGRAEDQPVR
jgi:hypothetical protein